MAFISKTNISTSNLIEASHITGIIDALDGTTATQINMTGAVTASNARITGSFTGSFVGSLAGTATTASFVTTAQTASYVVTALTASFVTTAQTASFVNTARTASYVVTALTASYVVNAQTASYISPTFISASAAAEGFGSGGGITTPAGSNFAVQYNDSGSFGGTNLLMISSSIVVNSAAAFNYAAFDVNSSIDGGESYGTRNLISVTFGTVYNYPVSKTLQVLTGNIMLFDSMGGGASANAGDVIQYNPGIGGWQAITDASDTKLADGSIGLVVEDAVGGANIKVLFDGLIAIKATGSYWGSFNAGSPPSWTIYPRDVAGSVRLNRTRPSTAGYILRPLGTILANNEDSTGARWLTVQWRPELNGTTI
jgi:hypothetical protein